MPLFPLPALIGFSVNAVLVAAVFYQDPFDSSLGVGLVVAVGLLTELRGLVLRPSAAV